MSTMFQIDLADEKFASINVLRDVISALSEIDYCVIGSFLNALHFERPFSGSFDILVQDENNVYDRIHHFVKIDRIHGVATLAVSDNAHASRAMKLRIVETSAKSPLMREFLVANSDLRTCILSNQSGDIEKIDIQIPKRGPTIIASMLEVEDKAEQIALVVENIVWSLTNVGVAPLLRESRFVPQESIEIVANKIEDLFVTHANKTITILHAQSKGSYQNLTASELKKLGRPFAALLRA